MVAEWMEYRNEMAAKMLEDCLPWSLCDAGLPSVLPDSRHRQQSIAQASLAACCCQCIGNVSSARSAFGACLSWDGPCIELLSSVLIRFAIIMATPLIAVGEVVSFVYLHVHCRWPE